MSDPGEDMGEFLEAIGRVMVAPRYGATPPDADRGDDGRVRLLLGDCLAHMVDIPAGSIDCIITDPPYPEIERPYGRMTEAEWFEMMRKVVAESRRVLKPTGSAVFILQPNSRKVGSMRGWLYEFQAWAIREWNMVQDVSWWNIAALPNVHAIQGGLLRPSLKACVWLGPPDCYRDQSEILWGESEGNFAERQMGRCLHKKGASRANVKCERIAQAAVRRGGVTPFNVIPIGGGGNLGGDTHDQAARTPLSLADWWIRFICPPRGVVLDPFAGSGTVPEVARRLNRRAIAIERYPEYFRLMQRRLRGEPLPLFDDEPPCSPASSPSQLALFDEPP